DPGRIAARPSEAGDETELDRVFGDAENDRDRPGCGFSRQRRHRAPWRRNHTRLPMHQVSHLLGEPVEAPFRQAILDGNVLALDVAGFTNALSECGQKACTIGKERPRSAEEPDHRHRGLLRARRKRPRGRRAAEQRYELAPFQLIELHSKPTSQGRFAGYRVGRDQSAGIGALAKASPSSAMLTPATFACRAAPDDRAVSTLRSAGLGRVVPKQNTPPG